MKRSLLCFFVLLFVGTAPSVSAQNLSLTRSIITTGIITDDGVSFAASSDDAEQENDEMDALYDDDIDAGWEGAPDDQNVLTAGMRFQNIFIPPGATIDSAFITVYSHEAKTAVDVANITIAGEADDNASTYTEDALITDRPPTSNTILWKVDYEWGLWTPHSTPDLKDIVQEVVDRSGWASGNAMAFMFLGENQGPSDFENAREWESFENIADPDDGGDGQNHPERIPQLKIYYTVSNGYFEQPIVVTDTITDDGVTFAASSDDAEQENDEIDSLFDDDIDAGWEGAPDDQNILTAGLRFQQVGIPQGAVIDSAFIEVVSHEAKTSDDVAQITITAEAVDHAETFTEDNLITDRTAGSASFLWTVEEPWGLWTTHRTPNISTVVQEVVDRAGWVQGNAIAFILAGENQGPSDFENAREWESYENIADPDDGGDGQNHPDRVPKLIIYYSSANTTSTFDLNAADVKSLKLYPNPAAQQVRVELESVEPTALKIFNVNGQLVSTIFTQGAETVDLNVQHLNAGIYFVQAEQNEGIYVQKLILEK